MKSKQKKDKREKKDKPIYTAWHCPNGRMGHYVCYMASQKNIDEHLRECTEPMKPSLSKLKTPNTENRKSKIVTVSWEESIARGYRAIAKDREGNQK